MTKFWFISDLHQEFLRDPDVAKNPATRFDMAANCPSDVDAVIIAGDLDVSLENSLRRIADELPGMTTIYVPGNHDFYTSDDDHFTLTDMKARGQDLAEYLGITLLQDASVVVGDVRIIGATLWTDFLSVGTGMMTTRSNSATARDGGMRDYRLIKRESSSGKRKRLRPEDTIAEHKKSRAYIERELQAPHDGETIVVTHHAPHPGSLDTRYKDLNYCYASNLQGLLEETWAPEFWLHGHIHRPVDYTVGKTQIMANPRGYSFHPSDADNGFDAGFVLEVGSPAPKLGW